MIMDTMDPGGTYIALDWDSDCLEHTPFNPDEKPPDFHFFQRNFASAEDVLRSLDLEGVDGLLADLGLSLDQIRKSNLGFSFEKDDFLDMRLHPDANRTAADLLHNESEEALTKLFRKHGLDRHGRALARTIVDKREKQPVRRTLQLLDLIEDVCGEHNSYQAAARVFQALRSRVNRDLENLERLLESLPALLNSGGRACVISFQPLEDRRVKQSFLSESKQGDLNLLTEEPVRPERDETLRNPASRSATLRAVERRENDSS